MNNAPDNQIEKVDADSAHVDAIADSLISSMPEVQEHAVTAHAAKVEIDKNKDAQGNTFNPAIHAADPAGNPIKTAAGTFAKRRGRKAGQSTVGSISQPGGAVKPALGEPGKVPADAQNLNQATQLGTVAASLTVQLACMIGGDDFAPICDEKIGIDESASLQGAYRDYFLATGRKDFPPGVALTLALSFYVLPRFTRPKVKTRLYTVWTNVREAWAKWRTARRAKKDFAAAA